MSIAAPEVAPNYARAYGRHDFTAQAGRIVSVISEPDWDSFYTNLSSATNLGDIALSPELITSPISLDAIPEARPSIQERIEAVRELSLRHMGTTVVLGTATFEAGSDHPANSQLYIRAGRVVAQVSKGFSHHPLEKSMFSLNNRVTGRVPEGIAGLVCSDILGETSLGQNYKSKIRPSTITALVSCCWAVPVAKGRITKDIYASPEERFKSQLENCLNWLFRKNPTLEEVIVADRTIPGSGVEGPLNGQFMRAQTVSAPPVISA